MLGERFDTQFPPIEEALDALSQRLALLEANPVLASNELKAAYLGRNADHPGSVFKDDALMICAQVDENSPLYAQKVLPLIERIEQFFSPISETGEFDFIDQVRMLRSKNLIQKGQYQQADALYRRIVYSPIYALAFAERNQFFLKAAKNHLHLMKTSTQASLQRHQLIATFNALQYVLEYPHRDDIFLYKNAESLFAHEFYLEAKMLLSKICHELLPDHIHQMSQNEVLAIYQALLPHKHLSFGPNIIKMLQQQFIAKSFIKQRFYHPEGTTLIGAHQLLDEPTSTTGRLQHIISTTTLERNFRLALSGDRAAEQSLWEFSHPFSSL